MTDTQIEIIQGDIAQQNVDAIVNAANNHLWMGAGTAGAIVRAGGREIEDEAIRQGPIEVGEAIVTGPGNLQCRHVIHAAAMGQNLITSANNIRDATNNSLKRAEELGLATVAFPALGTGVGGFDYREAAEIMLAVSQEHSGANRSVRTLRFVLFDHEAFEAFQQVARQHMARQRVTAES